MSILIEGLIAGGEEAPYRGWIFTEGPLIADMGHGEAPEALRRRAAEVVTLRDDETVMPGVIDTHVHFREPGLTHKATIASESRAAVAGGVTSYIDMPNTVPQTVTLQAWEEKNRVAERDSAANYAFMMGATADNMPELLRADRRLMPAVKVFMGSSTGGMLLDADTPLRRVFASAPRIVVHAEDQHRIEENTARYRDRAADMATHTLIRDADACARATERAMELAAQYGCRLHVAHVTTRLECEMFTPAETPEGKQITAEVSPHHLLFCDEDYARLGARIKMNPAVKSAADREALRRAVLTGRLDSIATDHAPHLLAEKAGDALHAVSGAPMVQFSLVKMLDLLDDPTLVARRMANAPAAIFGIDRRGYLRPGCYADMVIVRRRESPHVITDADVLSLCGWTPLVGTPTQHEVVRTIVNGDNGPQALQFN